MYNEDYFLRNINLFLKELVLFLSDKRDFNELYVKYFNESPTFFLDSDLDEIVSFLGKSHLYEKLEMLSELLINQKESTQNEFERDKISNRTLEILNFILKNSNVYNQSIINKIKIIENELQK